MSHDDHEHDNLADRSPNDPAPDSNGDTAAKPQLPAYKLTPELIAWAKSATTDEELLDAIREIRGTGGLELKDFIHQLEDKPSSDA